MASEILADLVHTPSRAKAQTHDKARFRSIAPEAVGAESQPATCLIEMGARRSGSWRGYGGLQKVLCWTRQSAAWRDVELLDAHPLHVLSAQLCIVHPSQNYFGIAEKPIMKFCREDARREHEQGSWWC